MCGRYFIDDKAFPDTLKSKVDHIFKEDRHPGDLCDCLTEQNGKIQWIKVKWGIKNAQGMMIINARSETYEQKVFFQGARRAIVLASGFYEWDKEHHQMTFQREHTPLYMAGIIKHGGLCILTEKANAIMQPIHARMPVMLEKEEALSWVKGKPLLERNIQDLKILEGTHQISWFEG